MKVFVNTDSVFDRTAGLDLDTIDSDGSTPEPSLTRGE